MAPYARALFLALLGLVPVPALASGAHVGQTLVLTLDRAVQEAMDRNPQIAAARTRWEASKHGAPQARSLDDPSVYTMFWAIPDGSVNPFSARETWYGIKQRVPFPGKLALKGRIAESTAALAENGYRAVRDEVLRKVKAAYLDLFLMDREIEITREHLDLTRAFADIAEARYATYTTGGGGQADVLKALVEVSDLSNRLQVLRQRRVAAVGKLSALLNREHGSAIEPVSALPIHPVGRTLVALQQVALENRPELVAMRVAIGQAKASAALARKDYYPDFMVDLSYWNVKNNPNRWMLMVEAKLPIAFWSKGKHEARVQQADLERRAWEADYEEMENQILHAVEEAFVDLHVARDNVDLYRRTILPQARQAVEAVRASYQTERATFLNLVDSERVLLRFDLVYYRAMVDHEKGLADLERAVGAPVYERGE